MGRKEKQLTRDNKKNEKKVYKTGLSGESLRQRDVWFLCKNNRQEGFEQIKIFRQKERTEIMYFFYSTSMAIHMWRVLYICCTYFIHKQ